MHFSRGRGRASEFLVLADAAQLGSAANDAESCSRSIQVSRERQRTWCMPRTTVQDERTNSQAIDHGINTRRCGAVENHGRQGGNRARQWRAKYRDAGREPGEYNIQVVPCRRPLGSLRVGSAVFLVIGCRTVTSGLALMRRAVGLRLLLHAST